MIAIPIIMAFFFGGFVTVSLVRNTVNETKCKAQELILIDGKVYACNIVLKKEK